MPQAECISHENLKSYHYEVHVSQQSVRCCQVSQESVCNMKDEGVSVPASGRFVSNTIGAKEG